LSQTLLRQCCDKSKIYISHWNNEPSALLCDEHIKDKVLLIGVKKVVHLQTKQEVKI